MSSQAQPKLNADSSVARSAAKTPLAARFWINVCTVESFLRHVAHCKIGAAQVNNHSDAKIQTVRQKQFSWFANAPKVMR